PSVAEWKARLLPKFPRPCPHGLGTATSLLFFSSTAPGNSASWNARAGLTTPADQIGPGGTRPRSPPRPAGRRGRRRGTSSARRTASAARRGPAKGFAPAAGRLRSAAGRETRPRGQGPTPQRYGQNRILAGVGWADGFSPGGESAVAGSREISAAWTGTCVGP